MDNLIKRDVEGAVARLSFNRPDSLNAINPPMLSQLIDALTEIRADTTIKVVIVSGEGRAFSAGVDLKTTRPEDFQKDAPFMVMGKDLPKLVASMPQVMIAQVHGYCFTGALEFMLCFDLMFCDDQTQFGDTHAKWSIIPQWGMTQRLARQVGLAKAKELSFRAMRVKGQEAERIGLVNRSFAVDTLPQEVDKIVEEICGNSPEAIARIKSLYDQGYATTLEEGLRIEASADTQLSDTGSNLSQFEQKKFNG